MKVVNIKTKDAYESATNPRGKVELVHFDRVMPSDEVLAELDKRGLRPASLREMLVWANQKGGWNGKDSVVALASVWRGWDDRRVPYLWCDAGGRFLFLGWLDRGWYEHCRFAAAKKTSDTRKLGKKALGRLEPFVCEHCDGCTKKRCAFAEGYRRAVKEMVEFLKVKK